MDPLRLLARSTNLQTKLSAAKQPADRQIPSAGAPSRPQFLREGDDVVATVGVKKPEDGESKRSLKRKRKGVQPTPPNEEQKDVPNFFSPAGPTTSISRDAAQPVQAEKPTAPIPHLSPEDERRRILRSHKIKITLMDATSGDAKSEAKQRRKRHDENSGHGKSRTSLFPQPLLSFGELQTRYQISRRLAGNLTGQGYTTPTEVQLASLPLLLGSDEERGLLAGEKGSRPATSSHVDLMTIAPTGSGKTLAFLIPLLNSLLRERRASEASAELPHVKSIILAPTHELADQIVNEGKKLALGTSLRIAGMRKGMQLVQAGPSTTEGKGDSSNFVRADVIVSTPLTLLHTIPLQSESATRELPSIRYLVLDEADVLLDPLFREQTQAIWNACTNQALQTSLWSATIGSSIETLAQTFIAERRRKLGIPSTDHHLIRLVAGLKDSALPTISHRLVWAATEQGKLLAVRQLLHPSTAETRDDGPVLRPPFLVFTQTIPRAVALHSELLYDIPPEAGGSTRIAVLHSDLSDNARADIMAGFRKGEIWVLVTTDLLSRGIDFRGMNGICNYDIPTTAAAYVHRAGRTGRAGRAGGVAVTLYTKEDVPYLKNIVNVIAAAEKGGGGSGSSVQQWLLDALPAVGKRTKQDLKRRGVEARRTAGEAGGGAGASKKARISTKSGFDRRAENRRKAAIRGSRRRHADEGASGGDGGEEEWDGIGG